MKDFLQPIRKNFGDEFIYYVAKVNKAEFCYLVFCFWNKADVCFVDILRHSTCVKGLQHTIRDRRANNIPIFLVKNRGHTIRTRCFGGVHLFKGVLDLHCLKFLLKLFIHFRSHSLFHGIKTFIKTGWLVGAVNRLKVV